MKNRGKSARVLPVFLLIFSCATAAIGGEGTVGDKGIRVVEEEGAWWFVGPDGKRFLSKGVDCIGPGTPPDKYDTAKPEYSAAIRPGDTEGKWRARTVARLRSWGFNTFAGWSDEKLAGTERDMVSTPVLHIGVSLWMPWVDMWVPGVEDRAAELARSLTAPYKGKPGILGYFLDNEFGWGDEYFIGIALGWDAKSPGKKLVVNTLRDLYGGDFRAFTADFTTSVTGWDALVADTKTVRKPGRGHRAIDAWMYLVARRYYEVCAGAVRAADPGRLILGDRFRQYYPQAVARAARGVLDVISTNYEAWTTDGWVSPAYFETMHALSGLPVMVGEFYATARQNRSGNRNSGGSFTLLDTQEQRAAAAAAQARGLASFPFVVGWHWFQFCDEPTFGRGDGEDYNMGLVDIYDEPYREITGALKKANAEADRLHGGRNKTGSSTLPLPVGRQNGLTADGSLKDWDKKKPVPRELLGTPAPLLPFGDVFLAWDEGSLWLACRAYDFSVPVTPAPEPHDPATWGELRRISVASGKFQFKAATGTVKASGAGDAGRPVLLAMPPAAGLFSAAVSSHVDAWHYVWEVAIPAGALGKTRLKAGDRFTVSVELENRGDYEKMALGPEGKGLEIILR